MVQYGPLHKDEITQHARDHGVDDLDSALQWNLLEMDCPARQLVDDRWVWLPAVLAGRVFTHRLNADESTHDVLTVTPDLSSITALCEHTRYQRLADGSTARVVLAGYDDELLDERNIPGRGDRPGRGAAAGARRNRDARRGRRRHSRFAVDRRRTRPRAGRRHRRSTRQASGWPRLSTRTNRFTSTQRSGARASGIPHCSPTRCRR